MPSNVIDVFKTHLLSQRDTLPYDKTVQAARQLAADPARYSTFLAPGVTVNGQP